MSRLNNSVPKYRLHRPSGRAVVTLNATHHYLGRHNSPESLVAYAQLIGEWVANGRRLPSPPEVLKIDDLVDRFWEHAQQHYVKHGRKTEEQAAMRKVLEYLGDLYGQTNIADFRPASLLAIRQKMIDAGNSRGYINQNVKRTRHVFKWGVSQDLVPEGVWVRLQTVACLKAGKCDAPEIDPIEPVDDATVDATLPHLPTTVADMVRLQRLTGMRPGEVTLLRPSDIDRSGDAWKYRPREHKMEHKGKGRVIFIGPQGQAILFRYLFDPEAYCFPPRRGLAGRYTTRSYRAAIHRACESAFDMPPELRKRRLTPEQKALALEWRQAHLWDPNQLRHTAATEIRRQFGLEAAQVILGHTKADTTQIYAERDHAKAAAVALQVG